MLPRKQAEDHTGKTLPELNVSYTLSLNKMADVRSIFRGGLGGLARTTLPPHHCVGGRELVLSLAGETSSGFLLGFF